MDDQDQAEEQGFIVEAQGPNGVFGVFEDDGETVSGHRALSPRQVPRLESNLLVRNTPRPIQTAAPRDNT
jgi:hypothetical protein